MKTCAEKFFEVLFYFCVIEFIWDGLSGPNFDLYRGLFNLSAALTATENKNIVSVAALKSFTEEECQ